MKFGADARLSLAQLTVSGSTSVEVVAAAARAGFEDVGLRLEARMSDEVSRPEATSDRAELAAIVRALADSGLGVSNVTGRYLVPETSRDSLARLVDAGAALGSRHVVAVSFDPDLSRAADNLAILGELAAGADMRVALEFITYNVISNLSEAVATIEATGRDNVGLMIDAIHLSRSGGRPSDLRAFTDRLFIAQLCDAKDPPPVTREDRITESRTARLYPGQGDLPLAEFMAILPERGCDIEVEAPHPDHLGLPADQRALHALTATRDALGSWAARRAGGTA